MAGVGRGATRAAPEEEDEEEDESEDEDEDEVSELVGYLEKPLSKKGDRLLLTRRMFPSKVGGKPAWLVPRNLPSTGSGTNASPTASSAAELACRTCARPLRFLLQVYASRGSEEPTAFHRALHLFVCTNCQPNGARLFRAQLPWENEFYSTEPPIEVELRKLGGQDPDLDRLCCDACGLPHGAAAEEQHKEGRSLCAECARRLRNGDGPAVFQERELSTMEATKPKQSEEDFPEADVAVGPPAKVATTAGKKEADEVEEVFTPGAAKAKGKGRDLVSEADSVLAEARKKGASQAVIQKLEEYRAKVAENAEHAIDHTEQAAFEEYSREQGERDATFSRFNRYSAANNGHVLRYAFGGQPLWFCGPGQIAGDAPPCQNCGGPRVFEFQVQPQLIALLCGTSDMVDRLEFGTICCYTCRASCTAPSERPYLEEFAYVQAEPRDAWLPKA